VEPSAPPPKGADHPSPRLDEPRRRRPTAAERRFAGFGDKVERAMCAAWSHHIPPGFPVHRRSGLATLVARTVARRPGAILLCDGAHPGPHRWPNGDEPTEEELALAPPAG
jgi:hypothetical protein